MKSKTQIAVSIGDYNSISPEVTIKSLNRFKDKEIEFILFTSKSILNFYEKNFGLNLENGNVKIVEFDFNVDIEIGKETKSAGEFSYQSLVLAIDYCKSHNIDRLLTAPISKNALHLAGYKFNGQTEILQEFACKNNQKAQMLFVAKDYRVLLLTRHLALKEVPAFLKKDLVVETVLQVQHSFKKQLGILDPKFALCSLNPHCGENGIMGMEEIQELEPAIKELQEKFVNIKGLYSADSMFAFAAKSFLENDKQEFDCYIACYHDQGLIPIKSVAKDRTVNVTIGLDILRASPAHGTAFDIAGKNIACCESMVESINFLKC